MSEAMSAASLAVAAFVAAKGGNEQDCIAMWNYLWGTNASLPTSPVQAFDDLTVAWEATREWR